MSATGTEEAAETVSAYIALRSFVFNGRRFSKNDPITREMLDHPRFESLVNTGYVRTVR